MNEETKRHFTEEEARDAIWNNEVSRTEYEPRRWTRGVDSTVEIDGRFYTIPWEEGLTENQEDEFYAGDYDEVVKRTDIKTVRTDVWVPVDSPTADCKAREEMRQYVSMLDDKGRESLSKALQAAHSGDYSELEGIEATEGMSAAYEGMKDYKHKLAILSGVLDDATGLGF